MMTNAAAACAAAAAIAIGLGLLGGATLAGSPLLDARCAMVLGAVLTGVSALSGKWRGTATNQRAVTATASPIPPCWELAAALVSSTPARSSPAFRGRGSTRTSSSTAIR